MKKIFLINILFIFLIILSFEFYLYKKSNDEYPFIFSVSKLNHTSMKENYENLKNDYYELGNDQEVFLYRRPVGLNYNYPPIILFGGSFAWGARLHEYQTFHYLLSELTKRPVYNRAISGWGTQHMLYQLKQEDFYSSLPAPKYVIYLYISDHISRLYKYNFIFNSGRKYSYNYLKYNNFFGKLYEEKRIQIIPFSRIYNHYILRFLAQIQERNTQKSFDLLEKHLIECKKEIDKHWGENNTQFIVLDYEGQGFNVFPEVLNNKNIQKLKNEDNIIVIKTSDLTDIKLDENYILDKNDSHPNAKAWELITPLFAEKLQTL